MSHRLRKPILLPYSQCPSSVLSHLNPIHTFVRCFSEHILLPYSQCPPSVLSHLNPIHTFVRCFSEHILLPYSQCPPSVLSHLNPIHTFVRCFSEHNIMLSTYTCISQLVPSRVCKIKFGCTAFYVIPRVVWEPG